MKPQTLSELLPVSFAVAQFRYAIRAKKVILEPLFSQMQTAGDSYRKRRDTPEAWTDAKLLDEFMEPAGRLRLEEYSANKAIYEDTAATIVLLAAGEMDRFYQTTRTSLYERGRESYVPGLRFSQALKCVANQYKHLGKWLKHPKKRHKDKEEVAKLVDNAYRGDAAAEFLLRCNFLDYSDVERSILSCTDEIVQRPLVVDDEEQLPSVRLQYLVQKDDGL